MIGTMINAKMTKCESGFESDGDDLVMLTMEKSMTMEIVMIMIQLVLELVMMITITMQLKMMHVMLIVILFIKIQIVSTTRVAAPQRLLGLCFGDTPLF